MPIGFMLALQAGGMVVDWLGKNEQVRLGKLGAQVEQEGINANIATSRLEAEDASLQSMKKLRQTMSTQAAIFAARGTRSGAGSAALISNETVGNFNADQRMRKINAMGTEASLKAGKVLSDLHESTNENNIWGQFRSDVIKNIPTSPDAWNKIGSGFSAKNGYGFGLTKVGG